MVSLADLAIPGAGMHIEPGLGNAAVLTGEESRRLVALEPHL